HTEQHVAACRHGARNSLIGRGVGRLRGDRPGGCGNRGRTSANGTRTASAGHARDANPSTLLLPGGGFIVQHDAIDEALATPAGLRTDDPGANVLGIELDQLAAILGEDEAVAINDIDLRNVYR